jgi:hypothetical protein
LRVLDLENYINHYCTAQNRKKNENVKHYRCFPVVFSQNVSIPCLRIVYYATRERKCNLGHATNYNCEVYAPEPEERVIITPVKVV